VRRRVHRDDLPAHRLLERGVQAVADRVEEKLLEIFGGMAEQLA
jgi:hypothetical protein